MFHVPLSDRIGSVCTVPEKSVNSGTEIQNCSQPFFHFVVPMNYNVLTYKLCNHPELMCHLAER